MTVKITFEQQAERFLAEGAVRKRNPLRPSTVRNYRSQIATHLVPRIGKKPLQDIGNKAVKQIVSEMAAEGLSPNTIKLNISIIKKIRKSAVNEEGDQLFPASWNADMIDAPEADSKHRTITREAIQEALQRANEHNKVLYAVLAGTGLRIAEALAIQVIHDDGVSTVWIPQESKIIVRQQRTRTGLAPTKTKAGVREIDLAPELNDYLIKNADTHDGFLFPGCVEGYRDRLVKGGIDSGFHSFRRFRITYLRMSGVPQAMIDFWDGHAASTMSERYTQVGSEIESRKEWAAKAGLGFQLPEVSA